MKTKDDEIKIKDAMFPKPFSNGLEFNAPVHGTWNIVHIGLGMPEAVQIYVCAKNCMRGVILTAAEMNESERFSFVILEEEDMVRENIESVTVEGVCDVIRKRLARGMKTKAVQLFTVCVHHFLGCNYDYVYDCLEKEFPDIDFYRCFMDPVMQKKGLTPDQKLRRSMFSKLPQCEPLKKTVSIIGGDFCIDRSSDIMRFLQENDVDVRQMQTSGSYEEFLKLSEAELFVDIHPAGELAVRTAANRLNRKYLYLPAVFDTEKTYDEIRSLGEALDLEEEAKAFIEASEKLKDEIEEKLVTLSEKLKDTAVTIDGTAHPRPLSLARLLITHGIYVKKVYLDAISKEEEEDFFYLKENFGELILSSTMHVKKRYLPNEDRGRAKLAIGQKAAYFEKTGHFVNIVVGMGLWGLDGILKMLNLMEDAFENEKDTRDIVLKKGLGCESCVEKYI